MIRPAFIKKVKWLVVTPLLLIFCIPLFMWLLWFVQPRKIMHVVIMDKTVADWPRQEHRGFNWVLAHLKISKQDGGLYDIYSDYFGFFPLKPLKDKKYSVRDFEQNTYNQMDSIARNTDMVYFTDMYGVYRNEWYVDTLQTEHSSKIYGGTTTKEVYLLQKLKELGKLIICEFNVMASPTESNVRQEIEKTFDIHWTGWTCRYFDMLDTLRNPELPHWVVNLYKAQHRNQWNFHNSGLVFVHEDSRIFILENKTHLKIETPYIHSPRLYQQRFGLPDSVHYPFWLDITLSGSTNQVVSNYKLYPNQEGDSILKSYQVPLTFPAVIEHPGPYRFYYLAGDFVDNPIPYNTCYFKGIDHLSYFLYNEDSNDRKKFFWKFYRPLMKNIVEHETAN